MSIKRVLFIGLGGAGQRHLRILKKILPADTIFEAYRHTQKTPLLKTDFTVDEGKSLEEVHGIVLHNEIERAFAQKPDLTVISTPTSCHKDPLFRAIESGSGIIVEKPWAEDLINFTLFSNEIKRKKIPFLISFQRRYHPLIAKAYEIIKSGKIGKQMAASFTVYSDVTTWHDYEDWRTLYAVRKDLGGGVLLTEIHEIDLACWFFGLPKAVYCSGGNRGAEKLDVEDTVQLILLYNDFSVQITLCFVHKKRMRHFHIACTGGALLWNEEDNKLQLTSFEDEKFEISNFSNDTMFHLQAMDFVYNWTAAHSDSSLFAAGSSLAIVEAAKKSMESGQMIPVSHTFISDYE